MRGRGGALRCARCGRRGRTAARRAPDGRLVTDVCARCLEDAGLEALGLRPPAPRSPEPSSVPPREASADVPGSGADPDFDTTADARSRAVLTLGLLITAWGGVLGFFALAVRVGYGGRWDGLGPLPTSRAAIFASSGVILTVIGLCVGLGSLPRERRVRVGARLVEAAAVALGLTALALGIAFHNPRRDPWVVAFVASAALLAWGARRAGRGRAVLRG